MISIKYQIKAIPNFPDYFADTKGNIWSDKSSNLKKLKLIKVGSGHLKVNIYNYNNKRFSRYVHQLVLESFVGPCPNKMETCHNDGDPTNNKIINLRWDTCKNNCADRAKHGRTIRGERYWNAILNEYQVRIIRQLLIFKILSPKEIAKIFRVSRSCIYHISSQNCWIFL